MNNALHTLFCAGCLTVALTATAQSDAPSRLRTDLLLPQKGITLTVVSVRPSFGWELTRQTPSLMQSAYRILVASSEELLKQNKGDVWDSGKVNSAQSAGVEYGGTPLTSGKTYYWKVCVWDEKQKQSKFSSIQTFTTAPTLQRYATSRYPIIKEKQVPIKVHTVKPGHIMADFGKDAFCCTTTLTLTSPKADTVWVHLGEATTPDGLVDKDPPCKITSYTYLLPLSAGTHTYNLPIDNGGGSIKPPTYIGAAAPFRYLELEGYKGNVNDVKAVREGTFYPYQEQASYFESPDSVLNKVWELCKYSVKATSFLGQFIDGDRERKPYEGDNYIGQLTAYASFDEYTLPRYSHEYTIFHPTWPSTWMLCNVLTAWNDYLFTGDLRSIRAYYEDLKHKSLMAFETPEHLISISDNPLRKDPAIMATLHKKNGGIADLIDWPSGDGYIGGKYKSVINAYYYRNLVLLGEMATLLDKPAEAKEFARKAAQVKTAFYKTFWDTSNKRFCDSNETEHASLHANIFPLAFGLVNEEDIPAVEDHIRSRGMACSVYGAQFLLEAVYRANDGKHGRELMASTASKSWYNMIREGSTITMEAWGNKYKGNQDWNHIWGAAAGNMIMNGLIGVFPLKPGWTEFLIKPQLGGMPWAKAKVPTTKGAVLVDYRAGAGKFTARITIPGNTQALVQLPATGNNRVSVNGKQEQAEVKDGFVCLKAPLKSGDYVVEVK